MLPAQSCPDYCRGGPGGFSTALAYVSKPLTPERGTFCALNLVVNFDWFFLFSVKS